MSFFYLFFYVLFVFLILRFTVTLFNFISYPKLLQAPRSYHEQVSVFILPGKDRQQLMESFSSQDYKDYELISLTEKTRTRALEKATGRYFLFIDPSSTVKPGLINNAVHRMKAGRLDVLSLFPGQDMPGLANRLTAPLVHYILLSLLPLRLVRLVPGAVFSAASQQFLLFDASRYRDNGWSDLSFLAGRDNTRLMRALKASGARAETLLANRFLHTTQSDLSRNSSSSYRSLPFAPFQENASGFFLFTALVIAGPVLIFYYLNAALFYFALTLIALTRVFISQSTGENILLNLALHPLQMLCLLLISAVRFVKQFRNFVLRLAGIRRLSE